MFIASWFWVFPSNAIWVITFWFHYPKLKQDINNLEDKAFMAGFWPGLLLLVAEVVLFILLLGSDKAWLCLLPIASNILSLVFECTLGRVLRTKWGVPVFK